MSGFEDRCGDPTGLVFAEAVACVMELVRRVVRDGSMAQDYMVVATELDGARVTGIVDNIGGEAYPVFGSREYGRELDHALATARMGGVFTAVHDALDKLGMKPNGRRTVTDMRKKGKGE